MPTTPMPTTPMLTTPVQPNYFNFDISNNMNPQKIDPFNSYINTGNNINVIPTIFKSTTEIYKNQCGPNNTDCSHIIAFGDSDTIIFPQTITCLIYNNLVRYFFTFEKGKSYNIKKIPSDLDTALTNPQLSFSNNTIYFYIVCQIFIIITPLPQDKYIYFKNLFMADQTKARLDQDQMRIKDFAAQNAIAAKINEARLYQDQRINDFAAQNAVAAKIDEAQLYQDQMMIKDFASQNAVAAKIDFEQNGTKNFGTAAQNAAAAAQNAAAAAQNAVAAKIDFEQNGTKNFGTAAQNAASAAQNAVAAKIDVEQNGTKNFSTAAQNAVAAAAQNAIQFGAQRTLINPF
jgi:hypothetical protein